MSMLERYFARPNDVAFDDLTICDYYSKYRILTENSEKSFIDNGNPKRYIVEKKNQSICGIQSVPLLNVELFSLRLLLNAFPYRSFDDILIYEDKQYISFNEIAIARGLLKNGDEFKISLEEAIKFNRPPSELRFLLVLLCKQGAKLEELLNLFKDQLSSDLNSSDSDILLKEMLNLYNKMNLTIPKILEPFVENDYNEMNNQNIGNEINDLSFSFNDEQQYVIDAIITNINKSNGNLMFLQGQAGTGKTYLTQNLIKILQRMGKNVLITGTTGIAAAQYNGGSTLHSLFSLGIEKNAGNPVFKSNIGTKSYKAKMIIDCDLLIIDEVSMLTIQTANKVDFNLRYLMEYDKSFEHLK